MHWLSPEMNLFLLFRKNLIKPLVLLKWKYAEKVFRNVPRGIIRDDFISGKGW